MNFEQLAVEAMSLTSQERALLADKLVESLDEIPGGLLEELWAAEAQRRLNEVRSGLVRTIPADEAAARVRLAAGL